MVETTAYSMECVSATLDGLPVRGLWDGDDAITVERGSDVGQIMVGAAGDSIFSQSSDRSARITIKLQHTSPTHSHLYKRLALQQNCKLRGFPFTVIDRGSGEGGVADKCFIEKAPSDSKGKNATTRDWVLVTGEWIASVPNP